MRKMIVAVGRWRQGPDRALYDDYVRRLAPPPELIEVEEKRKLAAAERVHREGELLLAKVPDGAFAVALDARGKTLTSETFAERIAAARERSPVLAFIIGGADGLAAPVVERADLVLSLGAMTWPHMLVRVMLAEQLYRAEAILAGHPYHRAGPPPI